MDDQTRDSAEPRKPYTEPEVTDYGSLQELTAHYTSSGTTDVPRGTHGPTVFS